MLADGRVLITGGIRQQERLSAVEYYDPYQRSWTPGDPLHFPRDNHTATVLGDGRVLVVGGWDTVVFHDSVEILEPETGRWTSASPISEPRLSHTATLLRDGKVLVTGGLGSAREGLASSEVFDPATGQWTFTFQQTTAGHRRQLARLFPISTAAALSTRSAQPSRSRRIRRITTPLSRY